MHHVNTQKNVFQVQANYRIVSDTGSEDLLEIQKKNWITLEGKKEYRNRASGEGPIGIIRQQKGINEIPVTGSENIEKRLYVDYCGMCF